jgi:hypothetical protein
MNRASQKKARPYVPPLPFTWTDWLLSSRRPPPPTVRPVPETNVMLTDAARLPDPSS